MCYTGNGRYVTRWPTSSHDTTRPKPLPLYKLANEVENFINLAEQGELTIWDTCQEEPNKA